MESSDCIDSGSSTDIDLHETNVINAKIDDNSELPLNNKDELNWVENEIVVVDSVTDKLVVGSVDYGGINDSGKNAHNEQPLNETADCTPNEKHTAGSSDLSETKLWEYFTEHNSSQLRCNLCLGLFLYQSNALQLLRHVEVVHKVSVLCESDVVNGGCSGDLSSSKHLEIERRENVNDKNDNCEDAPVSIVSEDVERVATPVKLKKSGKVWKCFTVLESGRVRCNLCCRVLSQRSNELKMLRHLLVNHCDTYKQLVDSSSDEEGELGTGDSLEIGGRSYIVQDYFINIEASRVKCKFCSTFLKFTNGNVANLIDHLKSKHKNIFVTDDYKSKNVEKVSDPKWKDKTSVVFEIIQQGDKCLITKALLHNESNQSALAKLSASKFSRNNMLETSAQAISNDECLSGRDTKSQVWDYFTKSPVNSKVHCNICSYVFLSSKSMIKLCNHLSTNHGIIVSKRSESNNPFDFKVYATKPDPHNDENLNFEYNLNSKLTVDDISNINLSSILHSGRNMRSKGVKGSIKRREITNCRLWKYYIKLYRDKAMCKLCNKTFTYKLGQISNLIKHLRIQHKFVYIKTNTKSIMNNRKIDGINFKQTLKRTNKMDVWNFFTKVDDSRAECDLCELHVYYSSSSRWNLMKHLRRKHKYFLDLMCRSETEIIKNKEAVVQVNQQNDVNKTLNDECSRSTPGIDMKTLFDYFSNDENLRECIKFENDQIVCKLCTGLFLFDDLLNFEYTIKYHVETCHANLLNRSAFVGGNLSADRASDLSDELDTMSSSSYNELEAISNEINSYGK